jgi:hypothetical protein
MESKSALFAQRSATQPHPKLVHFIPQTQLPKI